MSPRKNPLEWTIFSSLFLVRLLVAFVNHFNYHIGDSPKYIEIAKSILSGHPSFVLNNGFFIAAPIYPFFIVAFQLVFGEHYIFAVQVAQMLISSLSGIFLFRLCQLLFNHRTISLLATAIYGILPTGIFFTFKIAQESLFTATLILSIYYLVRTLLGASLKDLALSALFFSITLHIKSIIGIFSPFIILTILFSAMPNFRKKILFSILYGALCYISTIPYGLYNLHTHGTYTVASTGPGCVVYFGNTEMQYQFVLHPPSDPKEYLRLLSMDFSYANGSSYDSILAAPFDKREKMYYREAYRWIRDNPKKFVELKIESARLFLTPSVSKKHYPFKTWLFSLLTLAPVFLAAYLGIFLALRQNFSLHSWVLGLFISLFVFMVVCGSVSRYRTALLEPFYAVYAAYAYLLLYEKLPWRKSLKS